MLRRFVTVLLAAILGLSLIVAALYFQDVRHQRMMLEQEGLYAVELGQEFLAQEFRTILSDLHYLAQQETLQRFLAGNPGARRALQREYARFAASKAIYDQVRFLDVAGQEVVRINYRDGRARIVPPEQLQPKSTRYYYREAQSLGNSGVFVSPFDLNVEHGQIEQPIKPVIRFLTPVFDETGNRRGLLALNYLGAHVLAKLQEISGGFEGRTMLVNSAGEYLQGLDPQDDWGWLLNHERNFRNDFPEAWQQIKQSTVGQFRVQDDLFTLQRVSPAQIGRNQDDMKLEDPGSLLLLSYIPGSVQAANIQELLEKRLLLAGGALVLVIVLALPWARAATLREDAEQRLAASESRLRLLSSRLLAAQESERRSISRTLHDELGQQVTAISLDLKSALNTEPAARTRELVKRAIAESEQLLIDLHQIASRVRPSVLDDLGLHEAVQSFIEEFGERTGITVHAELSFRGDGIPSTVCENAYRILQEALSNAATHARSAEVSVIIRRAGHILHMMVEDAGSGFDLDEARSSTRLGVLGMRERVELLNGKFEIESAPGQGTRISVALPLNVDTK